MKPGNDLLPLARDLIAQGRLAQASHCLQALLRLQHLPISPAAINCRQELHY